MRYGEGRKLKNDMKTIYQSSGFHRKCPPYASRQPELLHNELYSARCTVKKIELDGSVVYIVIS